MADRPSLEAFFAENRRPTMGERTIVDALIAGGWTGRPVTDADAAEATDLARRLASRRSGDSSLADPSEEICHLIDEGARGRQPLWQSHFVAAGRKRVLKLAGRSSGAIAREDLLTLPDRRFSVALRRTFDMSRLPDGVSPRLRLPMPLEDFQLRDVSIELESHPGTSEPKVLPGRIETRPLPDHGALVSLGARFTFTVSPGRPTMDGAGPPRDTYLRLNEGLIEVTPSIQALARDLAPDSASDHEILWAFWIFMMTFMACGPIPRDRLGADAQASWAAEHHWFDCQVGSALLASLCRARNIPARLVGGYLLYPTSPGEHYWAEIWLDGQGWTPIDTLGWELAAGGVEQPWRDIFFGATDYRMKTQSFPDRFTGPIGIPMPREWHRFQRATADGIDIDMVDIPSGDLIVRDTISVTPA